MKKHEDQLCLGEIIKALGAFDAASLVGFDFAGMSVGTYCSYRGYYEDLCIIPSRGFKRVDEVLRLLKEADGDVVEGWKGGSYKIDAASPVWVSFEGCNSGTIITGVDEAFGFIVLRTRQAE